MVTGVLTCALPISLCLNSFFRCEEESRPYQGLTEA
jgi:hypothetical protein